jgi:hypothetical protein
VKSNDKPLVGIKCGYGDRLNSKPFTESLKVAQCLRVLPNVANTDAESRSSLLKIGEKKFGSFAISAPRADEDFEIYSGRARACHAPGWDRNGHQQAQARGPRFAAGHFLLTS